MRTEEEIQKAIETISADQTLTYGYQDDIVAVLEWVLGGDPFDGIQTNTPTR